MHNSLNLAIAIFGVQAAGAQVVLLNPDYTSYELQILLDDADGRSIIYEHSLAAKLKDLTISSYTLHPVDDSAIDTSLLRWRSSPPAFNDLPSLEPDSLSTLQYTGGTTGRPKGVNITYRAASINVSQREALLPTRPEQERILAITPIFHSYALAMGVYMAAYSRSTLYILTRYKPDIVLEMIQSESITILLGSPTIYAGLLAYENLHQYRLGSLYWCSSGAAALSSELLSRWAKVANCPICEGYGQTESGPVLTYNPLLGVQKAGTVGLPVPDTEIKIVDVNDDTTTCGPGEQGEILARGPQIMHDYRGLPEQTTHTIRNGWLATGDIGKIDEDGYLSITDRKKDMVIVGGYNVYPREIEEALYANSSIKEAAVVGVPDSYRGEILVAYVTTVEEATEESIKEFLAQRLSKYKLPETIRIVDELPHTSVGKINKIELRKRSRE